MAKSKINLEYWMTNLPAQLRTWPLIRLAIPGSHDSMTSSITKSSKIAPDAECLLQKLRFLGPLLRLIMSRWSKTQDLTIGDQLRCGIRYYDLRVATRQRKNYPYFVHGLYADEITTMLTNVREFIDSHPHEVVILDFQHFYAFSEGDHHNLITLLLTVFKSKLLPYTNDMNHITLEFMTESNKYQIILIYRAHYSRSNQQYLWPSFTFPTPWPQTISQTDLFDKLNRGIATRLQSFAYVSQCVLTPTNGFVAKKLLSTLKKTCVVPMHGARIEWIQRQTIGKGVNIVIGDFVNLNDFEFPAEVVKLNLQALPTNASILTPVDN